MNSHIVQAAFESGDRIDAAMNQAFYAAVRLHRMHGVPMALWEHGKVREVDPSSILLPEEQPLTPPPSPAPAPTPLSDPPSPKPQR